MKERPILFNTDMVKAILDGRKAQTRRVIKIPKYGRIKDGYVCEDGYFYNDKGYVQICYDLSGCADWKSLYCPYGQVGDRLWVRETLRRKRNDPSMKADGITYVADFSPVIAPNPNPRPDVFLLPYRPSWEWKKDTLNAMFMPRWASRINLEITEVRVERVQEIMPSDCMREGWNKDRDLFPTINASDKAKDWFIKLWDSLNAKRGFGWEVNPWVWVVGFKKEEQYA